MRSHDTSTVNEFTLEARVEELERQIADLRQCHDVLTGEQKVEVVEEIATALRTAFTEVYRGKVA